VRLIRRFIQPLRYQYLEYRVQAVGGIKTPDRRYMRKLADLLHPVDFDHYQSSFGMTRQVLMIHTNIGALSTFLKRTADLLLAKEMVPVEELKLPQQMITVDALLTVDSGYYVIPADRLWAFRQQLIRLLDVLIAHEQETVGIYAASWRQMRDFAISLQTLLVSLILISHECLNH